METGPDSPQKQHPTDDPSPARSGKRREMAAFSAVAILIPCTILLLLARFGGEPPSASLPPTSVVSVSTLSTAPPSQSAPAAAVGPSEAAPPDQSVPHSTDDVSSGETQPATPQPLFDFTAAERSTLDALLDAWAEKPTVGPTVQNEEGEDIVLPVPESGLGSGHNVALYFMDLDSGASYSYNAEARFSAASLPKAPFAAYLYQQAALGACDLDEYITVTPAHVAGSEEHTGVLKTYELPAAFSVEALIGLMIRESDTVALRVLMAHYGTEGFTAWAEALGASAEDIADVLNARICANDGGIFALELYKTMQENPYGALLREHMENTRQTMITSNYPVARKYGWDRAAYHDMAVVYAPHPYLLVILTDKWGGTGWETATFGLIASEVENMVAQKWAGLEGAASLSLLPAG